MHLNPDIATLLAQLNHPSLPGIDLSLARMEQLLGVLDNPQEKLPPVIHIAGTNGKGSTLEFIRAIYQAAGHRVHSYTSPHLVRFNERIVISGVEITDGQLLAYLARIADAAKTIPVTFFEATTALAFLAFAEHAADVVLLETGLGGRLDATNVVAQPMASVITPIDYDHMEFLGDSIEQIAAEKAGIMKPDVPCIVGAQPAPVQKVLARAAYKLKSPLLVHDVGWEYGRQGELLHVTQGLLGWDLPLPSLTGAHQLHNAALASVVVRQCSLPVSMEALHAGIRWAAWPARLQHLIRGPLVSAWGERGAVYLDGGHNPSAARALAAWLAAQEAPATLVCGMMARKDAAAFFAPLAAHIRHLITVPIPGEDSHTAAALADAARAAGVASVAACAQMDGLPAALSSEENGILLIAGSLFLAGWVLKNHG